MKQPKYLFHFIQLTLLLILSLGLSSCVTEDTYTDNAQGNFDALWKIMDEHYCFFQHKQEQFGVDWNEVHTRYQNYITPSMSSEQLFEVCGNMLRELKDGHVNLSSSFNTARYWDWYEAYPQNSNDSLRKNYLGTDYLITQGVKYKMLLQGIGYIYCPTFDVSFGSGNLSAIFSHLALATGLIVDVRDNGGGMLTSAQDLAECFINEKMVGGYICHKTGPSHNAFSAPEAITMTPAEGVRWQKPVIVLCNRQTFSAANTFVMWMKTCTGAIILGDKTGGGCGMPFRSELPNGWTVRFSACPMYNVEMQLVEEGIEPDIHCDLTSADWAKGKDTMIERAIQILQNH